MDDLKKAIIQQVEKSEAKHPADLVHEILILLYTKGYADGTKYMTVREDSE
ncbi:MAG: hypothetical protein J6S83_09800 [Lachnospiraceae bacterium]|nr:hypothetical protein [Lachnospiraceae bacterium]